MRFDHALEKRNINACYYYYFIITHEDHSQPLNVQYVVHISFVHINHTDPFKYSFMESSEVTGTTVKITTCISNYNAGCIAYNVHVQ